MARYAIGDVQGCFDSLRALLEQIGFDRARDELWFTGDLVNRGPRSADVVRFVKGLGERAVCVLGNHDLHLLAIASGATTRGPRDTLTDLLEATDREELLAWLASRPLFHRDAVSGHALVHAGLPPQWDPDRATALAAEAQAVLAGSGVRELFQHMYGDEPRCWDERLTGWERLRFIVNAFTRIRFCEPATGALDFANKGPPGSQPEPLCPWFEIPWRKSRGAHLVFGHWSMLDLYWSDDVTAIDTGCAWGRRLTAVRLSGDERRFYSVPCPGNPWIDP
ncbi:diadenosine tetraphosphatase [Sulfurifustis variabilis]|uniref:bis(5'-nucleosyl)-tetraphosphatase (symmetrical) n=1 Tax=Sulfurifustis variabilis TaxID=1675686 RepID=A0A1B4UZL3_9GAMM|nr:symmetrical bis(5'-nucleosyl)-tetraphosphatase [Sulfurifustis variabilis]BAU46588.1 diadenosine tetraphosphatase [Sulfurifustis variabilis]